MLNILATGWQYVRGIWHRLPLLYDWVWLALQVGMQHLSYGVGSESNHRALLATPAVSNVGRKPVSRVQ